MYCLIITTSCESQIVLPTYQPIQYIPLDGTIATLNCGAPTNVGTLTSGVPASGVSSNISYTGGNGGTYNGQIVTSTGVTGLTASLASNTFISGNGILIYAITGTPSTSGTASFALNIGGQACMLLWNVAQNLSELYPAGSVYCFNKLTPIVDVINPITGKIWMDRNLGALRVATNSTDYAGYGDLYQWGRNPDNHQCRTSNTTTTLSSTNLAANGSFIINPNYPYDWLSTQNSNLWQGVNGVNNPCPIGYRLPTEAEFVSERTSWSFSNAAGAFASILKLPLAGYRESVNGLLYSEGTSGTYWTSTIDIILTPPSSRYLVINSSGATTQSLKRAFGGSIRCMKN